MNDVISRQAAIDKFIDELDEIFSDLRERHVDDSVCGLCEYDGAYIGQSGDWCNECPGFEKDDCFKLSSKIRKEWTDEIIKALPPAQPETYKEKLNEIANALSEKFAYMNTCLNERDIILGYLGVKRPNVCHCNTDCNNYRCESYHYDAKKYLELSDDTIRRQAAIDECNKRGAEHIGYAIAHLPSAQPDIVRCKDCKYYDDIPCEIAGRYNTANDFCSRAERREG